MWSGKAKEDSSLKTECSSPSKAFSGAEHLPSACTAAAARKGAQICIGHPTASSPGEASSRTPSSAQQGPVLMDKTEKGLFILAAVKCLDAKAV